MKKITLLVSAFLTLAGAAQSQTIGPNTSFLNYPTATGMKLSGFPGVTSNVNGLNIGVDYHPSWGIVQPSANYSGAQWQVYGTAAQGRATPSAGTGNITLDSGSAFNSAWLGLPFFYFHPDGMSFGTRYKVSAITDSSHLTIQTIAGGAVSLAATQGTYYFVADVAQTVVNCSASVCTRVSGDLFSSFSSVSQPSYVVIAGTVYQANSSTSTTVTLTSDPGTLTGASVTQYAYNYDSIALFRVQKYFGTDEENLLIGARAIGDYEIRSLYSGTGKYRPIIIGSGDFSGTQAAQIVVQPDGNLSLGGTYVADSLRIQGNNLSATTNFLYIPTKTAGQDVTLSAGQNTGDTNVSLNLTTVGSGVVKANGLQVLTTTSPFLLQDNATFQFRAASGTNLNRWRLGQTIAGSSDGYFYLQHTTDGFVSNFFNAMACNTTGCAFGATTAAYAVDVTGQVNASTGFRSGGTAGLSVTKTVRASGGAADCTLIYTGGILTGGTC